MQKTSEHCDVCGKRIDFRDADGDYHINGIRLSTPPLDDHPAVFNARASYHTLVAVYSGFTEVFCLEVVCNPTCLEDALRQFMSLITAKWPKTPVLNNE